MKQKCILFILLLSGNFLLLNAQKPETAARDLYDWKAYDSKGSTVKKEAIDFRMLQGVWYAYEGWYYGDEKKFWKDYNNPHVLEIRGNQIKDGLYGKSRTYTLQENLIRIQSENKLDSAYINLITTEKLTISFKRGEDFENYMFQR
jgi:hypothetical protein